jgi:dienelactone hydrolase
VIAERVWIESDNFKLGGRLVVPNRGISRLGVLCITGGTRTDCDYSYLVWQKYMAQSADITSLSFNARGINDSDGSFRTDSPGYNKNSPANSLGSRVADTIAAHGFLKKLLGVDESRLGVIGGSMGGDIAMRALADLNPAALVLRAPAAYPDEILDVEFGPDWSQALKSAGGVDKALASSYFGSLGNFGIPSLLLYSGGETVVPSQVQDRYRQVVTDAGGRAITVGNQTTPHGYIDRANDPRIDTPDNAVARWETYMSSTHLLMANLVQRS